MNAPTARVLLIEDDQVDRLACRRALGRRSDRAFEVLEADTAREGLRLAGAERPDLILLDYQLPDLNGIEVLAELGAMPEPPPVVMLTGADNAAIAVEAMRRGARDYLVKDTGREYLELLPAVAERVLRERRTEDEKRQAETALRAERDFIAAVLGTVDALVIVLDREGRIVRFNQACETVSGYRFEEMRGKCVWDLLLLPEEIEPVKQVFAELRAGLFPNRFENHWRRRDGGQRLIAWSSTALTDAAGRVEYVIGTGLDITERRAAEAEARRYQAEIERLYRQHALGAMASVFAHELNQPLAAIVSYSEASRRLLRAGGDDGQLVHNLEQTALQAQRAAHIIRHVRNFLRRGELETSVEEPNSLVGRVVTRLAADAAAAGVRLGVDAGVVPTVRIERIAVEKVLLNLLQNALEAIGDTGAGGGTVTVRTRSEDAASVRITVEDTGPGLDTESAGRVFQPFYTTKPEGLGIGLAISRTIIEAHGGRLWTEPTERGAVFHFTVPVEP